MTVRQAQVELSEADERLARAVVALEKAFALRALRGEEDVDVTEQLETVRDELGVVLIEVQNVFVELAGDASGDSEQQGAVPS